MVIAAESISTTIFFFISWFLLSLSFWDCVPRWYRTALRRRLSGVLPAWNVKNLRPETKVVGTTFGILLIVSESVSGIPEPFNGYRCFFHHKCRKNHFYTSKQVFLSYCQFLVAWTFVPVLRKGRSPGWSLKRFDTFPVSQWFLSFLANHGDEFVQDSHLFPFSPD